jgi:succinate dehydrogenase/fumarate reductase flavoprotein subunit
MLTRENFKTDVLVIGGGIAGARAAVEAAGQGAQVTLVTKGIFGSGTSVGPVVCSGAGPWTTKIDSRDLHFEGIVVTGRRFLCDQEHARALADEAPERLLELEEWGHIWDRDPDGNITPYPEFAEEIRMPEESHHYHQNRYVSSVRQGMYFGYTGVNVLQTLRTECRRRGVNVIEEAAGVRLLTRADAVNGALALDYLHGRWLAIEAPSVILATGSIAQLWFPWGLASREVTGDGVAMAFRAGAAIQDLELMMTAYLPTLTPAWSGRHKLLQGVIEAAPGYKKEYRIRWINKDNEEFLLRYPPLAPKTYEELYLKVIRGVHTELLEGRGPLYMDYRSLPREFLAEVAPFILQFMDKLGRKRQEDWLLEVGPNPMWSFGGIKVSPATEESSVPGLFACADASNAIKDGFGASVACGVTTCLVTGARAGRAAAARSKNGSKGGIDESQVRDTAVTAERWGKMAGGVAPLAAKLEIGGIMREHMHLKHETGMMKALNRLQGVRADALPRLAVKGQSPRYCYELVEAFEIENMLDCAEMMVRASLMRKESRRHMFIREDYPHRDDANWLKHIVIQQGKAGMELKAIPVDLKYLHPDASGVRPAR